MFYSEAHRIALDDFNWIYSIKISNRNALGRNASRLSVHHCSTHQHGPGFPFIRIVLECIRLYLLLLDLISVHNVAGADIKCMRSQFKISGYIGIICILLSLIWTGSKQNAFETHYSSKQMQRDPQIVQSIVPNVQRAFMCGTIVMWDLAALICLMQISIVWWS